MKNKIIYIIFIYILFLSNIQSVFAEINGTIRDRVPESLILEYFPEYNKSQSYKLSEIPKISDKVCSTLSDNNINTTSDFLNKLDEILEIKGFGPKSVDNIKLIIEDFILKV